MIILNYPFVIKAENFQYGGAHGKEKITLVYKQSVINVLENVIY